MAEARQEDIVKVEVEEEAQEVLAGRQFQIRMMINKIAFEKSYQTPFKNISDKKSKDQISSIKKKKLNIVATETA